MKKLLILAMALMICGVVRAQGSKEKIAPESFLAFHGGPSFPMADFHSNDFDNADAGFAKTGYNLNLTYGYKFIENFGLTASLFYNNNMLDEETIQREMELELDLEQYDLDGLQLDHWKWYGLTIGPALMRNLGKNVAADLRVMAGIANANTPSITFQGQKLVGEDWSVTAVLQAGADLRIAVGKNLFIFTNLEYTYMKPKFNVDSNIDELVSEAIQQKLSVLNLTGGLGIRF